MRARVGRMLGGAFRRHRVAAGVATALLLGVVAIPATAQPALGAPATSGSLVTMCKVLLGTPVELTVSVPRQVADRLLTDTDSYEGPCALYGKSESLGNGKVTAFSQSVGLEPKVIGLLAEDSTFDGLPYHPMSSGLWCYDKDQDGTIGEMECAGGHERYLPLNPIFTKTVDSPFTYVLANWNPMGHIPPGVWDTAHFDVHFYMNSNRERVAIRPGPCPQLTNCDDYKLGKVLPEEKYRHPDYADLDAVEPAMGNHLLDTKTPELNGGEFTSTFIYGSWNGEITFYEPMVNLEQFNGLRGGEIEDTCVDIKAPQAWQRSGWYPTKYCLRHRDNRDETLTTLEEFVYREAS